MGKHNFFFFFLFLFYFLLGIYQESISVFFGIWSYNHNHFSAKKHSAYLKLELEMI